MSELGVFVEKDLGAGGYSLSRGKLASTIKLQHGPIKEVGVNGIQIDDVIRFARDRVAEFNRAFPCDENEACLSLLGDALSALADRTRNRESRGVEGTNQA